MVPALGYLIRGQGILVTTGGGKNKYGHRINRPGGLIDAMLGRKKSVDKIVATGSQ